jgi:hypothetical protein
MSEKMNLAELEKKLMAAARANPPSDRVPYAFEKRIMARLAEPAAVEVAALWARTLWRGAISCVALALLVSAWFLISSTGASRATSYAQQFETTMLAAADQETDTYQ